MRFKIEYRPFYNAYGVGQQTIAGGLEKPVQNNYTLFQEQATPQEDEWGPPPRPQPDNRDGMWWVNVGAFPSWDDAHAFAQAAGKAKQDETPFDVEA